MAGDLHHIPRPKRMPRLPFAGEEERGAAAASSSLALLLLSRSPRWVWRNFKMLCSLQSGFRSAPIRAIPQISSSLPVRRPANGHGCTLCIWIPPGAPCWSRSPKSKNRSWSNSLSPQPCGRMTSSSGRASASPLTRSLRCAPRSTNGWSAIRRPRRAWRARREAG